MGNRNVSLTNVGAGTSVAHRQHQAGRRYRIGPRELPLGWPGHRQILISYRSRRGILEQNKKAGLVPAFLFAAAMTPE
jgi:hypothetical protein